jgi:hypothetical protein
MIKFKNWSHNFLNAEGAKHISDALIKLININSLNLKLE